MKIQKIALSLMLMSGLAQAQIPVGANEFYNNGADVYVQAGGLIYVQGEVVNDDEGAFIGRIYNSGDIQLEGSWTNTSTSNVFQAGDPGTTTFLGANPVQTIGGTTDTYFNNLTLDKPGGTFEVRQLRNSLCDGVLSLTSDFLNTQTFFFTVSNTAPGAITRDGGNIPDYMHSTTQGYVTSDVLSTGRLVRSTLPGGTYFFPVGTAARWRPVEITPTSGALNAYSVQFVDAPTPNINLKAPTLSTINPAWYHFLERGVAAGSPEVIRIYSDFGPDDICDINNVTMSEWNNLLWDDLSPTVSANPAPFMSWTEKAGYPGAYPTPWNTNRFALAGLFIAPQFSSCVFPIEMTHLSASPIEDAIRLDWGTASESNNAGWEIQRSTDNENFATIGWENGAGNSQSPMEYQHVDRDVVVNQTYFYRLRQMDLNGEWQLSNVVEAMLLEGTELAIGEFFPNPAQQGQVSIVVHTAEATDLEVVLYNGLGQQVRERDFSLGTGSHTLQLQLDGLPAGPYFAHLSAGGTKLMRKLVID